MSEKYCVSRITSKKALELLAEEGRIIRMAGKGSFVSGAELTEEVQAAEERREKSQSSDWRDYGRASGRVSAAACWESLEMECKNQGFSMVLRCSYGNIEEETRAIDELLQIGVEGIIIMCVHDENYNSKVLQLVVERFPIVTIDRQLKGIPLSFVGTNNEEAARELANYLLNEGYKKICFAMPASRETSTIVERQNGLTMAFREHGMIADESLWITDLKATLPSSRSEENLERICGGLQSLWKAIGRLRPFLPWNTVLQELFTAACII